MGARVYDPDTGTFLQTDPIPGADANAYGYTDGDPVNETDLTGREVNEPEEIADTPEAIDNECANDGEYVFIDDQAATANGPELHAGPELENGEEVGSPAASERGIGGQAGEYNVDELSQMAYEHGQGADNAADRPSASEIETTMLKSEPERLEGQNAVRFERGNVRVIINEDSPVSSTAYRIRTR